MQRAQIYQNPEQLTIAKLKTELKKHGVALPDKSSLKAVYVGLYRSKVQSISRLTDDDIQTKSATRAQNAELRVHIEKLPDNMTIGGIDVQELTDDELRRQLKQRGFNIGPILQSTRSLYEKKLENALRDGASGDANQQEHSDQDSYDDEEEDDELEVEEPVVVETRRTRRSMLQQSAEKGDSATRRRGMRSHDVDQYEEQEVKEELRTPTPPAETKHERLRPARRWVPVWMQILIVIFIALIVYLIAKTMETNPPKLIPRE